MTTSTETPSSAPSESRNSVTPETRQASRELPNDVLLGGEEVVIFTNFQLAKANRVKSFIILGLCVLLGLSLVGNLVEYGFRPEPKVVAQDAEGRITPIRTLDEPVMTPEEVASWTAECMEQAYKISYVDIPEHRTRLSLCFTPKGLDAFQQALDQAGFYQTVRENHYLASAVRTAPPVIAKEGLHNGRKTYLVEVPIQQIYRNDKKRITGQKWLATVQVGRVSLNDSREGIQIGRVKVRVQ